LNSRNAPSILVAYPSSFYCPSWQDRVETKTSLLLLSSYLARFFPVEYIDLEILIGRANTSTQLKRFERQARILLESRSFDILAISCWTSLSFQATMVLARICRELYPNKLIVVGGYHPSARPHDFMTDDNLIDYVILGEGELPLQEIASAFPYSGRPSQTQIIGPVTFPSEKFVPYNWDLVQDLFAKEFPGGIDSFYIYLSRGCPFGCSFCMEPLKERSWRALAPAAALLEIKHVIERFNPFAIALADACFGMRPSWRKEFLRGLAELAPKQWLIIETRAEYLDEEDIKLLSNLKVEVEFGVESGSADMLLLMKKTRQPEKFLANFKKTSHLLSQHGILHRANMIFNHPGETHRTLEETFDFIDHELENKNSSLMWACVQYMHFPGCELDSNLQYYEKSFGTRVLKPEWWKGTEDMFYAGSQNIPSSDIGESGTDLWEKLIRERNEKMKNALTPEAFRFAAAKYFPEWKDDHRFRQRTKL
jgi:radical SAM superfamily enzyme YgiQ (UPF0313 family)